MKQTESSLDLFCEIVTYYSIVVDENALHNIILPPETSKSNSSSTFSPSPNWNVCVTHSTHLQKKSPSIHNYPRMVGCY